MDYFTNLNKSIISIGMVTILFAGCANNQPVNPTTNNSAIEVVEPIVEQGVFLGLFGESKIDIKTDEGKNMYSISEDTEKKLKDLKEGTFVRYRYEQPKQGLPVIVDIDIIKENSPLESIKPTSSEKDSKKNSESKSKVTANIDGISLTFNKSYEHIGNSINHKENKNISLSISRPLEEEVKKMRWRAADELNEFAPFKEYKGNDIEFDFLRGSEFVFSSDDGTSKRTIAVKDIDGRMIKITIIMPTENQDKFLSDLNEMLSTINNK